MTENNNVPQKEPIGDVLKKYKEARAEGVKPVLITPDEIPSPTSFNPSEFEKTMSKETDSDLMTSYEIVKLPSRGLFYQNRLSEVSIEYMTSKDEDLLTTPSLIENGTVLDVLLKRKIKTKGVNPDDLLSGDRNAIKTTVDLLKLKYKKIIEEPNEFGHFTVVLPMRKKTVKFKLLASGEENILFKQSEAIKEAYSQEFSEYSTLKLKSHIISIDEKTDRTYIGKFVDAMPALDALTIRRKIMSVSPDVDMDYEFVTKDGYKFNAQLSVGIDFFFPNT